MERQEENFKQSTFVHLRLKNDKLYKVLETNENVKKTSFEKLAIWGNSFYFPSVSKFYGPKFEILKEDSDRPGEFLVKDKIVVSDGDYSIMDVLSFRMNANLEVLSVINSVIDGRSLYYDTINYLEIREIRKKELEKKLSLFKEHTNSL